ncbi:MAG: CdaR family protein [Candidatus Binataceae bacterium]
MRFVEPAQKWAKERFRWSRIRRTVRRNMGLRILSLLLAIALWIFVNTGQHQAEVSMQVPVSYSSLPAGLVIVNHHPPFIKMDIVGPRTLLSLLDPGRMTLRLDLAGVNPGQASFRISPEMFSIPHQTSITRIVPSQLTLDIDKVIVRNVPIKLSLEGKVAHGYEVASISANPATVKVRGAAPFVSHLNHVYTEPLNVQGAAGEVAAMVPLVDPGSHIKLALRMVQGVVMVRQQIANREFRRVKVQVRDTTSKVDIDPGEATITVRGPMLQVAKLNLSGAVFVDAGGVAPGLHTVPLQIKLPDGIDVVRENPQKIKLRVYRDTRASSG